MGFFFKVLLSAYLFVEVDFLLEPHYRLVLCSFHCELSSFYCNFLFLRFFSMWVSFIKIFLFAYLFVEADFLLELHYQLVLCSFRCELISFNCNFLFLMFFSLWIPFFKVFFSMGFFFKVLLSAYLFVKADFLLEPYYRLVL